MSGLQLVYGHQVHLFRWFALIGEGGAEGRRELGAAGEEVERLDVVRAYHGEVAAIECRHLGHAKALGGSDD